MANFVVTYPFDNSAEYDKVNTEISAGKGRLSLTDNTGETFNQAFTSDSGFTYDSAKAEFVAGKVQQKKVIITDEQCYLPNVVSGADAQRFITSGTGTAFNGASTAIIGGKNYLDLTGRTNKYFSYPASNAVLTSNRVGTVRFKVITAYSGHADTNTAFFTISGGGALSKITLYHESKNSNMRLLITKTSGSTQSNVTFANWAPVDGVEYEFELRIDLLTGSSELYIDGVSQGTAATALSRLDTVDFFIGDPNYNQMHYIRDFQVFNTVQHTSEFPDEIPRVIKNYQGSKIECPQFSYSDVGNIQAITNFTTTETSTPKYIINDLYYNSGWVSSNGSYAQANSKAEVLANIASLPSPNTLNIDIVFDESIYFTSVDDLTVTYTGQEYYASGSITTGEISVEDFVNFIATEVNTANTTITYAIYVNNVLKYYNGSAWVSSNGLFAQTNTVSEMNINLPSVIALPSTTKFYILISTSNQQETGEIDLLSSEYEFVGQDTSLSKCVIWGYYKDISGNAVSGATVTFRLKRNSSEYKEASNNVIEKFVSTTTDSTGYFEQALIRSSEYEGSATYTISIAKSSANLSTSKTNQGISLEFIVPDELDKNITDILTAV